MKTFSLKTRLTILAVIIGPLSIIPAMLIAQSVMLLLSPTSPDRILYEYAGGIVLSTLGLIYAYGFTIFYGLPIYLLLNKFNRCNIVTIIIASMIPALILGLITPDAWIIYIAMGYFSVVVGLSCYSALQLMHKSLKKE